MATPDRLFDIVTAAQDKALQLKAMLVLATCGGPDSAANFEAVGEAVRHDYLWACTDLARDLTALVEKIPFRR